MRKKYENKFLGGLNMLKFKKLRKNVSFKYFFISDFN